MSGHDGRRARDFLAIERAGAARRAAAQQPNDAGPAADIRDDGHRDRDGAAAGRRSADREDSGAGADPRPARTSSAAARSTSPSFLTRRFNGVFVNEIQSNPFQPDINYRGYTASPLLGTPQGLSVYMDGVRLNQPFGDVVSWDLIPRLAIATTTLMPGSNPLFGLNTLGGALAIQTKDGLTSAGHHGPGDLRQRRAAVDRGRARRQRANGLHWYVGGQPVQRGRLARRLAVGRAAAVRQDRVAAPATRRWRCRSGYADNSLNGNGLQEQGFLDRDYASVYTKPDTTDNRSTLLNVTTRHSLSSTADAVGQRLLPRHPDRHAQRRHQRRLARPGALPAERRRAGRAGRGRLHRLSRRAAPPRRTRRSRRGAASRNVLLNDEPAEKCNGLINRTRHDAAQRRRVRPAHAAATRSAAAAISSRPAAATIAAASASCSRPSSAISIRIAASPASGAFGDGETGGEVDGEPFDTRVDLDGLIQTCEPATRPTRVSLGRRWTRHAVGPLQPHRRFANRDAIEPGGGPGSLDGDHAFSRFNPAAGVTFSPSRTLNVYGGYSEGSRAPTSIELGCADPGGAVQAAERDGRRSAAGAGGDADLGSGRARRLSRRQLERRRVPRRQPRRHPVRHVRADRLRLLQELRRDAPAGPRARRAPAGCGA